MRFWQAMKALEEGKRVRCKSYFGKGNFLSKEFSCIGIGREWIDEEWELYEEPEKTYSFMEVVKGLKEGKRFKRKEWIDRPVSVREHGMVDRIASFQYLFTIEDFEATDWIEVK